MDSIPHKTCTRCKQPKPLAEFYAHARYKDGYMTWCKVCKRAYDKERLARPDVAERNREYMARWYADMPAERKAAYVQRRREYDKRRWRTDPLVRERKGRQKHQSVKRRKGDPVFEAKRRGWKLAHNHRRRARIAERGGEFSYSQWAALLKQYGYRCLCCGASDVLLTPDHIVPLSRGGSNSIDNIQPLCAPCNGKKSTKTIDYRVTVQLRMDL